ncbi:DUF116 domain-containing protein [bacterium]|nr:DUF116 domain-containing protein [bacterium]
MRLFSKSKVPQPGRRYDSLGRPYSPQGDRILGHEWADWDGDLEHHEGVIFEPPRLFLCLGGAALFLYMSAGWTVWWMIAPRLAQYNPTVPRALLALGVLTSLAFYALYALLAWSALSGRRRLPLAWARRMLDFVHRGAFLVGRWVGKDKDHVGNSFVELWNALQAAEMRARGGVPPDSLLVLLPRCLEPSLFKPIKALCDEYGCRVVTVGRGRHARDKIRELCPGGVIGVACERDLVTGINDTKGKLSVLGVNIQRVAGPCKDAQVDLAHIRAAIQAYLSTGRLPQA